MSDPGPGGIIPGDFFRRMAARLRQYPKQAAPYVGLLMLEVLLENTAFPIGLMLLIDRALPNKELHTIVVLSLALSAGAVIYGIAGIAADRLAAWISTSILNDIRMDMYTHIQRLPVAYYAKTSPSVILSRFSADLGSVEYVLTHALPSGLRAALGFVACLTIMVILEWRLALIALVVLPLGLLGPMRLAARSSALVYKTREQQAEILHEVQESIRTQMVVKTFRMRDTLTSNFRGRLGNIFHTGFQSMFFLYLMKRLPILGMVAFNIVVLVSGSVLVFTDLLTIGALVAFSRVAFDLAKSVGTMSWALPDLVQAGTGLDRIDQILREPAESETSAKSSYVELEEAITFEDVTFGYDPEKAILRNVNLRIPKGASVAFVGESGSGKSTFLNLLARFYDPQAGRIRFDGTDLGTINAFTARRGLAAVFQDSLLFSCSVRDNLRLAKPGATDAQIEAACRAAEMHETILKLPQGYDTVIGEAGGRLSGGERQRLAIARALLCDPRVLLLDEATSALDPNNEHAINTTLRRVTRGRTVLSVTHRLQSATDADIIVVMREGNIVEIGRHHELLARNGLYANQWRKQSGFSFAEDGSDARVTSGKLRELSFLQHLDSSQLAEVSDLLVTEQHAAGTAVITEGEAGNCVYIVARGKLEVLKSAANGPVRITTLTDGDHFGEISLLRNEPRNATVRALTDCILLSLTSVLFRRLLNRNAALQEAIERTVRERQGEP